MDMMEIRRAMMGVIAGMASGANFVKGTITVPNDSSYVNLNFGKSFSKYLFFIEATDESKQTMLNTGINGNRTYAMIGCYPDVTIGEITESYNVFVSRINPSTSAKSTTYTSFTQSESSIGISAVDIYSGGANEMYKGYSYNYFIVEMT